MLDKNTDQTGNNNRCSQQNYKLNIKINNEAIPLVFSEQGRINTYTYTHIHIYTYIHVHSHKQTHTCLYIHHYKAWEYVIRKTIVLLYYNQEIQYQNIAHTIRDFNQFFPNIECQQ